MDPAGFTSLGLPNVSGFSCEAERSEVSSAAGRCWAARNNLQDRNDREGVAPQFHRARAVRDHRPAETTARKTAPTTCSADNTTGERRPHHWRDTPAKLDSIERYLQQRLLVITRANPMHNREPRPCPPERRQAHPAAEVQSSSPRRRSSERCCQELP